MLKQLSFQVRVNTIVGTLFMVGTIALSILLITIQTQNANQKFQVRYERLTELMSEAIAPGIHLKIEQVIKKKLESYITSSEKFISALMVVGIEGAALYQLNSEELPPFDLVAFLENHPDILENQEPYTEFFDDHLVTAQPAVLANTQVNGFTIIAWSTHTLREELEQSILFTAIALGAIIVIILLILRFVIGRETRRLTQFINLLKDLAQGGSDFTRRIEVSSQDEIGKMAQWFNKMLSNLQKTNDKQQWLTRGQTGVHEQLQGEQELVKMLQQVINYLANYLEAQVGVFYIMTDNRLKLMSSYAYKVRSANFNEFELGEGLVGQAALEQKSLIFKRPPQEHVQTTINTGMSEISPDTILVIPLIHQDKVLGVLELGKTGTFVDSAMEFLENISESIAISIYSAKSRTRLEELLEETQAQSKELQRQQEELRTSNEELEEQTKILRDSESRLQAQQEEIRVSNEELETQTKALEAQQAQTKAKNKELQQAQKELEEKAKALETSNVYKSEFLANMSHELRTPLNSLLLLAESLASNKSGNLTEKQIQFAETIHGSGKELLQLINEILDLSKIEAGKLEVMLEHYPIRSLKEYFERNFQQLVDKKGLFLQIEIEETLPDTLYTDSQRLEQILKNFMSNAIKFTEKGGITLRIHRPDPNQSFFNKDLLPKYSIAFSIEDTGLGIPQEKQNLIFEAFRQADGSTNRKYGGTGLGLSISKELTKLLGGEILIHSKEGEGSTFTICLPISKEPTPVLEEPPRKRSPITMASPEKTKALPPAVKRVASTETKPPPGLVNDDRDQVSPNDRTLLVIEDDPHFSQIVLELAHERDFKVITAENGEEGLELAMSHHPSAIILDVGLPQLNGWDVMEQLKNDLSTRHIPVHFISALDRDIKALQMGAIGFLSKPVDQESLVAVLQKIENTISQTQHHVLVIEDNHSQQVAMEELVKDMDVDLTMVETAEAAYKLIKIQPFDCVILDLGLKNMSGEEWLQKVHADKSLNLPPVIVYTGKDLSRKDEKLLEQYAESIIIKGAKSMDRLLGELNLFLHRVESGTPEEESSPSTVNNGSLEGKIVLLADDDSRSSFALSHHLEEHGLVVRQAFDGKEALETLEEDPNVDILLTDIMMPEMDGYETMKAIRQQDRFQKLPIIALTAKAMKQDRHKCIDAGANDYLPKPVNVDKLLSLMRVWVNQ